MKAANCHLIPYIFHTILLFCSFSNFSILAIYEPFAKLAIRLVVRVNEVGGRVFLRLCAIRGVR